MSKRDYHNYWVYIITNKPRGTLYIGVTGGLDDRMERHVNEEGSKFTSKYKLKMLVYYEEFQFVNDAIAREKQLKNWHRQWKINLIEETNPNWIDLWSKLDSENPEASGRNDKSRPLTVMLNSFQHLYQEIPKQVRNDKLLNLWLF